MVSVDLPCEDPNATFSDYAEVAIHAWRAVDDDLVVVGHSLAGLTIPLIAARRPIRELVFLYALIPEPGKSLVDQGSTGGRAIRPSGRSAMTNARFQSAPRRSPPTLLRTWNRRCSPMRSLASGVSPSLLSYRRVRCRNFPTFRVAMSSVARTGS